MTHHLQEVNLSRLYRLRCEEVMPQRFHGLQSFLVHTLNRGRQIFDNQTTRLVRPSFVKVQNVVASVAADVYHEYSVGIVILKIREHFWDGHGLKPLLPQRLELHAVVEGFCLAFIAGRKDPLKVV